MQFFDCFIHETLLLWILRIDRYILSRLKNILRIIAVINIYYIVRYFWSINFSIPRIFFTILSLNQWMLDVIWLFDLYIYLDIKLLNWKKFDQIKILWKKIPFEHGTKISVSEMEYDISLNRRKYFPSIPRLVYRTRNRGRRGSVRGNRRTG